jgi:hypothetical protein
MLMAYRISYQRTKMHVSSRLVTSTRSVLCPFHEPRTWQLTLIRLVYLRRATETVRSDLRTQRRGCRRENRRAGAVYISFRYERPTAGPYVCLGFACEEDQVRAHPRQHVARIFCSGLGSRPVSGASRCVCIGEVERMSTGRE